MQTIAGIQHATFKPDNSGEGDDVQKEVRNPHVFRITKRARDGMAIMHYKEFSCDEVWLPPSNPYSKPETWMTNSNGNKLFAQGAVPPDSIHILIHVAAYLSQLAYGLRYPNGRKALYVGRCTLQEDGLLLRRPRQKALKSSIEERALLDARARARRACARPATAAGASASVCWRSPYRSQAAGLVASTSTRQARGECNGWHSAPPQAIEERALLDTSTRARRLSGHGSRRVLQRTMVHGTIFCMTGVAHSLSLGSVSPTQAASPSNLS